MVTQLQVRRSLGEGRRVGRGGGRRTGGRWRERGEGWGCRLKGPHSSGHTTLQGTFYFLLTQFEVVDRPSEPGRRSTSTSLSTDLDYSWTRLGLWSKALQSKTIPVGTTTVESYVLVYDSLGPPCLLPDSRPPTVEKRGPPTLPEDPKSPSPYRPHPRRKGSGHKMNLSFICYFPGKIQLGGDRMTHSGRVRVVSHGLDHGFGRCVKEGLGEASGGLHHDVEHSPPLVRESDPIHCRSQCAGRVLSRP